MLFIFYKLLICCFNYLYCNLRVIIPFSSCVSYRMSILMDNEAQEESEYGARAHAVRAEYGDRHAWVVESDRVL